MEKIDVFAINLKARLERKKHIIKEFNSLNEFNFRLVEAQEHEVGAIGLWLSIKYILKHLVGSGVDFIVICEDDHQFTKFYSKDLLFKAIEQSRKMGADILLGGVSSFNNVLQISPELFWVDKFSGLQFTVIYRNFFNSIINTSFENEDVADFKISSLTNNKMIISPFISIQKEFGYSDVTIQNNEKGYVDRLFNDSAEKLDQLKQVRTFYRINF